MLEANVYKRISGVRNTIIQIKLVAGIPTAYYFGIEGEFNVLVIELLGPNLEDLFNFCGCKFKLGTTLALADQMVRQYVISLIDLKN